MNRAEQLRSKGVRVTRARLEILALIEQSDTPLSAEAIYQRCLASHPISMATVYRTLDCLSSAQLLLQGRDYAGRSTYQRNDHHHVHRLVCTRCHQSIEIENCPIEAMIDQLTRSTNFLITGHIVEVSGLCPSCQKKESADASAPVKPNPACNE